MKNPLLSTEEKRRWLARVFRDEDGEYSQADKFKALVEGPHPGSAPVPPPGRTQSQ